jgi:hypothetical protein
MKAFFITFILVFSLLTIGLIAGLEWSAQATGRALTPADTLDPVLPPKNLMLTDRAPAVEQAIDAQRKAESEKPSPTPPAPPADKDDLLRRVEGAILDKLTR